MKHVQACLSVSKDGESTFLQVCLCANNARENSLYDCGGPVKLMPACLCAENTLQRRFNRREVAVKHVQACLSARKDLESSFHHCGGPVKLVQACLCA